MDNYRNIDEKSLVELLFKKDRGAFVEIYDRYHGKLFIYAMKMLQDQEESKDLVQDIFIQLWKKRADLIFSSSIANYLYQSVRNRALNIFAHRKIEQKAFRFPR